MGGSGGQFRQELCLSGTYLANNEFQRKVLEDGLENGYIWKKENSSGPRPLTWVPIVPEGSKAMDVLAGAYGPKLLQEAFAVMNNPATKNNFNGFLSGMIAFPLAAKTVYSTGSTARNFFGNMAFVYGNGNFIGPYLGAGATVWNEALKKGGPEMQKYIVELTELGILGENVDVNMMKTMLQEAQKTTTLGKNLTETFSKLPQASQDAARKFVKFFPNAYSGVDNYWKVYAFEAELSKLKKAYAGYPNAPSLAEMKKQAAKIVRRTMPTYSEAWSALNEGKAVGKFLAPFIKFKTEVIRTSIGTMRQGWEEWSSDNPAIRKIGVRRLASFAMVQAMPLIIAAVTRALFGYSDEEEEAIRAALPDWQKSATMVFLPRDSENNPQFLDLSYMNPFNVYQNPLTAVLRSLNENQEASIIGAAGSGFAEFVRPFISPQLWLSGLMDISSNQDSQKGYQPLWNPDASTEQKAAAVVERIWRTVSPGTLDSLNRVWKGINDEVSEGGREYRAPNEILAMTLGARMTTFNPAQGLQKLTSQFERGKANANKLFMDPFTNRGTIDPQVVADRYRQANTARKAHFYKMRQNYLGSLKLGMTEDQAIDTMLMGFGTEAHKKGMTKDDLNDILDGKYYRYEPSKPAIEDAFDNHPDRYEAFMEAYELTPEMEDIVE